MDEYFWSPSCQMRFQFRTKCGQVLSLNFGEYS
ncbi:hypothetical protein T07_3207 [Trichinella nelsoni]|uniref:Uncharacterized protein n=1 Tax=Trichinella nelsoni TaxID=6336 RepID=A0A0V0RAC9_9BILA|nr:hypothetical protein T07_3207 [Trichinella nelsoni]